MCPGSDIYHGGNNGGRLSAAPCQVKEPRPELDATDVGMNPEPNHQMVNMFESWNSWDYRAWIEKRRRKERENEMWRAKMASVWTFSSMSTFIVNFRTFITMPPVITPTVTV